MPTRHKYEYNILSDMFIQRMNTIFIQYNFEIYDDFIFCIVRLFIEYAFCFDLLHSVFCLVINFVVVVFQYSLSLAHQSTQQQKNAIYIVRLTGTGMISIPNQHKSDNHLNSFCI